MSDYQETVEIPKYFLHKLIELIRLVESHEDDGSEMNNMEMKCKLSTLRLGAEYYLYNKHFDKLDSEVPETCKYFKILYETDPLRALFTEQFLARSVGDAVDKLLEKIPDANIRGVYGLNQITSF